MPGVRRTSLYLGCPGVGGDIREQGTSEGPPYPPHGGPPRLLGQATLAALPPSLEGGRGGCPLQRLGPTILRGGLCKGRGHKLIAPEHAYLWLWGLEAHHEWVGLSPSSKVVSLLIRNQGVVLASSLGRVKTPGNPGILELGAVAATPEMVL